jgi:hypothetical protein
MPYKLLEIACNIFTTNILKSSHIRFRNFLQISYKLPYWLLRYLLQISYFWLMTNFPWAFLNFLQNFLPNYNKLLTFYLWASYKHLMSSLQISYMLFYILLINFLQISYKLSYILLMNFLQTSLKHLTHIQKYYMLHTNLLQTTYKLLKNLLQASYKLLSKVIGNFLQLSW